MYVVLMAGGVGTRFWPRSRASMPKQLLNIVSSHSMLRLTYERIRPLTSDDHILIITSSELAERIKKHIPEIPAANIIAEPFGRNTAPCVGLASAIIKKRSIENEVMVVLPADHLIEDDENFRDVIQTAVQYAARHDYLITIGVTPTYPETGYGYIQCNSEIERIGNQSIYRVKTFAEKPNLETAQKFIQSGDFFWNSGMFIWNVKTILDNFEEHQSSLFHNLATFSPMIDTSQMNEAILDFYSKIKSISIDYGIMESAKKVCVIQADFHWNDIGSWEAVHNFSQKDSNGNAVTAREHVFIDSNNNYIYSEKKMIAAIGLENFIVVETDDALLICRKDQSQMVKDLVEQIKKKGLTEYL